MRRTAGDRERSWAALCRDEGTQRGTLVRWRSLEDVTGVSAAMRSSAAHDSDAGAKCNHSNGSRQTIHRRHLAHVPS